MTVRTCAEAVLNAASDDAEDVLDVAAEGVVGLTDVIRARMRSRVAELTALHMDGAIPAADFQRGLWLLGTLEQSVLVQLSTPAAPATADWDDPS